MDARSLIEKIKGKKGYIHPLASISVHMTLPSPPSTATALRLSPPFIVDLAIFSSLCFNIENVTPFFHFIQIHLSSLSIFLEIIKVPSLQMKLKNYKDHPPQLKL